MNPKHLIILAVGEMLVLSSLLARVALGAVRFEEPLHLAWFVGTALVSSAGVAIGVIRATLAKQRQQKEGGATEAGMGQPLAIGLTLIGLAALVSLAGPPAL